MNCEYLDKPNDKKINKLKTFDGRVAINNLRSYLHYQSNYVYNDQHWVINQSNTSESSKDGNLFPSIKKFNDLIESNEIHSNSSNNASKAMINTDSISSQDLSIQPTNTHQDCSSDSDTNDSDRDSDRESFHAKQDLSEPMNLNEEDVDLTTLLRGESELLFLNKKQSHVKNSKTYKNKLHSNPLINSNIVVKPGQRIFIRPSKSAPS